jgi:hypothetical protein
MSERQTLIEEEERPWLMGVWVCTVRVSLCLMLIPWELRGRRRQVRNQRYERRNDFICHRLGGSASPCLCCTLCCRIFFFRSVTTGGKDFFFFFVKKVIKEPFFFLNCD